MVVAEELDVKNKEPPWGVEGFQRADLQLAVQIEG